jgi:hypothetical protein
LFTPSLEKRGWSGLKVGKILLNPPLPKGEFFIIGSLLSSSRHRNSPWCTYLPVHSKWYLFKNANKILNFLKYLSSEISCKTAERDNNAFLKNNADIFI